MIQKLILLVLLVSANLKCASVAYGQQAIDLKLIGLIDTQHKGRGIARVGQSLTAVMQALGKPTKREKGFDEATMDSIDIFHYRSNILYFEKGKLDGFEVNDNTLAMATGTALVFKVGSKLTPVLRKGGASGAPEITTYLLDNHPLTDLKIDAKPGKSRNVNYYLLAWNYTRFGEAERDGSFEIYFDKNNQVINIITSSNKS